MRNILRLLIVVIAMGTGAISDAEELYLGRVLAVDRESGRLSVALMDEGNTAQAGAVSEDSVHVIIPRDRLSEQLSPGSIVRIWGNMSGNTLTLEASRLILTGRENRNEDPTGVRRRIGKSRSHYGGRGGGGEGSGRR